MNRVRRLQQLSGDDNADDHSINQLAATVG
jgi:hypothetical protein